MYSLVFPHFVVWEGEGGESVCFAYRSTCRPTREHQIKLSNNLELRGDKIKAYMREKKYSYIVIVIFVPLLIILCQVLKKVKSFLIYILNCCRF